MRDRHLQDARPLLESERTALQPYFDVELLDSVRLKEVSAVEKPPFFDGLRIKLSFVGMRVAFDFANASGLTFENCVLLNQSPLTMDLIFHEFVHAEQYRQLGVSRFAAAYVRGFAESGFVHEQIPLEQLAISLTGKFVAAKEFQVREEVSAWLAGREY